LDQAGPPDEFFSVLDRDANPPVVVAEENENRVVHHLVLLNNPILTQDDSNHLIQEGYVVNNDNLPNPENILMPNAMNNNEVAYHD
jgi:hypothetical protein